MANEQSSESVTVQIDAICKELRVTPAYEKEGHTARTIAKNGDLRVVLIAFKKGGHMADHQAKVTASVHVISGKVRFDIGEESQMLPAGSLLVLDPGVRHAVLAEEESALLLTLGKPAG